MLLAAVDAVRATVAELADPAHVHPLAEDAYLVKELTKVLNRLSEPHVDVVLDVCCRHAVPSFNARRLARPATTRLRC